MSVAILTHPGAVGDNLKNPGGVHGDGQGTVVVRQWRG